MSSVNNWTYTWDGLDEKAAGKAVEYSVVELTEVPEYETTVNDADHGNIIITNAYTPEVIDVNGEKTWKDAENQEGNRPDSITVNLLANGSFVDSVEVTEADDWNYSFTSLPKYEAGIEIDYTITENAVEGYETIINRYNITNVRAGETSVEGTKTWKDDNSEKRPESITVNLLRNDEVIDAAEVTAESGWNYEFENLQGYDGNGAAYVYTVEEEAVEGYKTTISGYDITNVRVGTTSVEGTKTWNDDDSSDRPDSIFVNLLQNGVVIDTKEVTAEDDWKYSFTDLEKYDADGVAYEYAVSEHGVPGYQSEVNDYDITNTRSETTSIVVTKGWKDDESEERPELITVMLLQNGEVINTADVTAESGWTYEFENLQAYDENGVAYVYTIEEEAVEGYETTVNGYDITNLRVGTTSVEGTKTWKDDNAEIRPESIVIELHQNGKKIETLEVTAADDWMFSFTDLKAYDENGVAYKYTVEEQEVAGYISTVEGYNITNTFIPVTSENEEPEGSAPGSKDDETTVDTTSDAKAEGDDPKKETERKSDADTGAKLPNTATNVFNLLAVGFGLLVVGFITFLVYRRKEKLE